MSFASVVAPPVERLDRARTPDRRRPPWYRRRWFAWTVALAVTLVLVFYAGGGWFFSGEIRSGALDVEDPAAPEYDIEVVDVGNGAITLDLTVSDNDHLTTPGIKGVAWPGGYGRVHEIISVTATTITRAYTPVSGEPTPGTMVDLDGFAYPGDPEVGLGLDFETVSFLSPLGSLDAWHVPASGEAWVIFVHGKSAPLREALRIIPTVVAAGWDALVIEYRNDPETVPDATGMYRYGLAEWQDLAAAVGYVTERAPDADIALFGYSMGGAVVASYLLESPDVSMIDAVVLDAPMLDLSAAISHQAADRTLPVVGLGVPDSLTAVAKLIAGWRYDLPWNELDYVARLGADPVSTPLLVFHGDADEKVPVDTSRRLAAAVPTVELIEVAGAGHVQSWNVDADRYEAAVEALLVE